MNLRHEKIISILKQKQDISIKELGQLLLISLNTIRKDLTILENKGLVIKKHGRVESGALLNVSIPSGRLRFKDNIESKQYIANLVIKHFFSEKINSIFIDESTTVLEFIKLLYNYAYPLTIISNFLGFLNEIKNNHNITPIICGGTWWTHENCTYGNKTVSDMSHLYVDIGIIGCSGIQQSGAIFNGNIETAELRQIMYNNSREIWILVDHSKFDKTALIIVLNITQVTKIFTDKKPTDKWLKYFSTQNIQIFY